MTNPMRGELSLNLGGVEYKARLTLNAIMEIEQSTGTGIIKLATDMGEGNLSVTNLIAVLLPALRGGGNDFDVKEVMKIAESAGILPVTKAVAELLAQSLSDSDEGEDEKKPAA